MVTNAEENVFSLVVPHQYTDKILVVLDNADYIAAVQMGPMPDTREILVKAPACDGNKIVNLVMKGIKDGDDAGSNQKRRKPWTAIVERIKNLLGLRF